MLRPKLRSRNVAFLHLAITWAVDAVFICLEYCVAGGAGGPESLTSAEAMMAGAVIYCKVQR